MVKYKIDDRVRLIKRDIILTVVEEIKGVDEVTLEMVNDRYDLFEPIKKVKDYKQ